MMPFIQETGRRYECLKSNRRIKLFLKVTYKKRVKHSMDKSVTEARLLRIFLVL